MRAAAGIVATRRVKKKDKSHRKKKTEGHFNMGKKNKKKNTPSK